MVTFAVGHAAAGDHGPTRRVVENVVETWLLELNVSMLNVTWFGCSIYLLTFLHKVCRYQISWWALLPEGLSNFFNELGRFVDPILEHRFAIHVGRVMIMQGPAVEVPTIRMMKMNVRWTPGLKLGRQHPYGVPAPFWPAQKKEIELGETLEG